MPRSWLPFVRHWSRLHEVRQGVPPVPLPRLPKRAPELFRGCTGGLRAAFISIAASDFSGIKAGNRRSMAMYEAIVEEFEREIQLTIKLLKSLRPHDVPGEIVQFLDKWQTLASGLLAVAAALVTVVYLRRQINIERDRLNSEKDRALKGARIRVPHALSPLSRYAKEAFLYWVANDPDHQPVPKFPHQAVETLMQIAVDVDDETFQSLRELVLWLQIVEARTHVLSSGGQERSLNWREVFIQDLLRLNCLTNRLYDYGRGDVLTLPYAEPTRKEMEDAVPAIFPSVANYTNEAALRGEVFEALNRKFKNA